MVGLKTELKNLAYDENFWPAGVAFSRFNFTLGRRFLDKRSHSQREQKTQT